MRLAVARGLASPSADSSRSNKHPILTKCGPAARGFFACCLDAPAAPGEGTMTCPGRPSTNTHFAGIAPITGQRNAHRRFTRAIRTQPLHHRQPTGPHTLDHAQIDAPIADVVQVIAHYRPASTSETKRGALLPVTGQVIGGCQSRVRQVLQSGLGQPILKEDGGVGTFQTSCHSSMVGTVAPASYKRRNMPWFGVISRTLGAGLAQR